jgi:hypothetical protein
MPMTLPTALLVSQAGIDKVLQNPAWILFGLTLAVAGLIALLLLLYPFGSDQ